MKEHGYRTEYTNSAYNRGAEIKRDRIYEIIVAPKCEVCGITLERKKHRRGIEKLRMFLKRRSCGSYVDEFGKKKMSECMRLMLSGKGNPNYKGLMEVKCRMCGAFIPSIYSTKHKTGNLPKLCGDCWKNNRNGSWNKKEIIKLNCKKCGKEITNRYPSGKINYNKNRFCSLTCANQRNGIKSTRYN